MPRPKRWIEKPIEHGIGVVELHKWQYFHDYVYQEMLDYSSYIWRGHRRDDWKLESTLDRLVRQRRIPSRGRFAFRADHLERFKMATRGRRGGNPPMLEEENDWWALGQHHGLATPLLDWTESPFVAAFFAFEKLAKPQSDRRAIVALSKFSVENRATALHIEALRNNREKADDMKADNPGAAALLRATMPRREVEFIRPPSDENQRLVNQAGLFTRAPDDVPLDDWVSANFEGEKTDYHIIKITVPNSDREDCLRSLNRMNINHLTLFPDLEGASSFCNQHCQIDKY